MFHATQFDFQTKILFGYQVQSGQKPIFMHVQRERNARKCRDSQYQTFIAGRRPKVHGIFCRLARVESWECKRSLFMQVMESQV